MNWIGLKTFRNKCAHDYQGINIKVAWDSMKESIPKISAFCDTEISSYYEESPLQNENEDELEL